MARVLPSERDRRAARAVARAPPLPLGEALAPHQAQERAKEVAKGRPPLGGKGRRREARVVKATEVSTFGTPRRFDRERSQPATAGHSSNNRNRSLPSPTQ